MEWKCILNELNNLLTCDHPIWAHTMGIYFIFKMAKHFISSLVLRHTCYGFCPLLTYVVVSTVYTRLSKIFEKFDIRFASNFSNIKNTWFEHIQTLNFRIRFDLNFEYLEYLEYIRKIIPSYNQPLSFSLFLEKEVNNNYVNRIVD